MNVEEDYYIQKFQTEYASDELELDEPETVSPPNSVVSIGSDGGWVRCWQFIPKPESEEEEE